MGDDEPTAGPDDRARPAPSSDGSPDVAQLLEQGARLLAASRELLARLDTALGLGDDRG